MGKFSDLPRFLLDNYFTESISTGDESTVSDGSYLHGNRASTVVDGGYWEKMWINVKEVIGETPEYPGFVEYKFKLHSDFRTVDNFNFDLGSLLTLPASANGSFDSGSEVYFKKGSYIYEWLLKHPVYKDYFNTNKTWLYFGKIYPHTGSEVNYRIIFDGMKNYVMKALPLHQRSDNLAEFMSIYFDKIYHKIYNMNKNVFSLLDAREIDTNWIEYIAQNYNMDTEVNLSGLPLREWVRRLVFLLKRRGTYTSLYIIWKIFLTNTLNNLNIYNRWHVDNLSSYYNIDAPLGHFYDILHPMSYGYEPVGCSGSNWYKKTFTDIATSSIYHQISDGLVWKIKHQMYTETMVIQCYDEGYNRMWPDKIEVINTGLVEITWSSARKGYIFLESDEDYLHSQNDGSIEWILAHDQSAKEVISQYQSLLYNMMLPDNVNLRTNFIDVDFSEAEDGYALVLKDNVVAVTQSTAASTWSMNHGLGVKEVLVQSFDTGDDMIQPAGIHLDDEDNCTLTWGVPTSGYIVVRSVEQQESLPDWSEKVLSPHYKVEVDLSCEPLDDEDDAPAILSEDTIDRLVDKWELMRPVTRYSHYHELISPQTDFTGTYSSLYSSSDAFLFSKFCAEDDEYIPPVSASSMYHDQYAHDSTWTITHELDTQNLIVQCYDKNNIRIWPNTITAKYDDTLIIDFDVAINGTASLLSQAISGYVHTETYEATEWTINHSLSLKECISQYEKQLSNLTYTKAVPSGVYLNDTTQLIATWTGYEKGLGLISAAEIIWAEATAKTTWYIDHRLGSDSVISQFFDDNNMMIQPDTITLASRNRIIATFPAAQSGYCIIRAVNKAFLETDIIDSIIDGGYWMLGEGTSGSNFNPVTANSVETMLVSGSEFDSDRDNDFYYFDLETGPQDEDWNITEIAWFDKYNQIRFYTYCSPIHKPKAVWFNSHYRIIRSQT
jgi:hypothetical protein